MVPLKWLHPDSSLSRAKLQMFAGWSTEKLCDALKPGQQFALKARPDDTVLDGHHRLKILRERNVDIDALPREVIEKTQIE